MDGQSEDFGGDIARADVLADQEPRRVIDGRQLQVCASTPQIRAERVDLLGRCGLHQAPILSGTMSCGRSLATAV